MPNIGELFVRLRADTSNFEQGMSQAQATIGTFRAVISQNLNQIGQQMSQTGKDILSSIGSIVTTASEWSAQVQQQKFVYDNLDPTIQKAIDNNRSMAESLGMTKQQYMNNTTATSDFLARTGMSSQAIADQSGKLTTLTADMAAFADVPVDDAAGDFRSALMGNFETLDKYGISLSVATIEQGSYAKEIGKSWTKMTQAEKAQATLSSMIEQGASISGLAKQESGGFTMQMQNLKQKLMETAGAIGEKLFPVLEPMISKISEIAQKVADWANEHPKLTQGILLVIGVIGVLGTVGGTLLTLFAALAAVSIALNIGMLPLTGIILAITTAIVALVAIGVALWQNWDTVKAKASEIWNAVVQSVSNAANSIVEWFSNMINSAVQWATNLYNSAIQAGTNFLNAITTWFSQLPQLISTWLTTTLTNISTWCSETWNTFITWCTNIITSISEWFSQLPYKIGFALGFALGTIVSWGINTWNYLVTNVPLWINGVVNFFSQLPGRIWSWLVNTYNKVVSWGSQMLSKAVETGKQFISNVVNFIQTLPERIYRWLLMTIARVITWSNNMKQKAKEAATAFINNVTNTISQLPGKVWSFLSNTISKVSSFVSQMGSKARSAASQFTSNLIDGIKTIPSKVVSIGKDIVGGLWKGIKNGGTWLKDQIGGFADGVVGGFKKAFKIQSPSRLMRDEIGKFLPEGIAVGIKANAKSVYNSLDDLASTSVAMSSDEFRNVVAKSNSRNTNEVNGSYFTIDYDKMAKCMVKAVGNMAILMDGKTVGKTTYRTVQAEMNKDKIKMNRLAGVVDV